MKDWLTIIIVVLILVILVDGVRRMRLARRDKIRVSRNVYKTHGTREETPKADLFTSELPNGGARVVTQRDHPYVATKKRSKFQRRDQHNPEQTSLNLDEAVPMLMESVVEDVLLKEDRNTAKKNLNPVRSSAAPTYSPGRTPTRDERIEPTFSTEQPTAIDDDDYQDDDDHPNYSQTTAPVSAYDEDEAALDDELEEDEPESDELENSFDAEQDDYEDDEDYESDEDDSNYEEDDEDYRASESESQPLTAAADRPQSEPEEVMIINVMANKGETFRGDELLDVLLKCGMRYGDMDIFHRYSDSKGEGTLLFSMANMVKPGTFDLEAMEQFDTPGVSLFMTLPLKADSMQSFELMVDTARTIAETLYGELKDEQRSVMTRQTVEHCRERIRDFERRRLFSRQR